MIRFIRNLSPALLIPLSYIACRRGLDEIRVAAGVASDSGSIIDVLGALGCVGMAIAMALSFVTLTWKERYRNSICAIMIVAVTGLTWLGYFRDDLLGYYALYEVTCGFAPVLLLWVLLVAASFGVMIGSSPIPQWARYGATLFLLVAMFIGMLVLIYPLDRWIILCEVRERGLP